MSNCILQQYTQRNIHHPRPDQACREHRPSSHKLPASYTGRLEQMVTPVCSNIAQERCVVLLLTRVATYKTGVVIGTTFW